MTLIEFIGFIVSMFAIIYMMGRRAREERTRKKQPPEIEEEIGKQKEELKEIFAALNIPMEEEFEEEVTPQEAPPPPPRLHKNKKYMPPRFRKDFSTKLSEFETHTKIEDRHIKRAITDETIDVYEEPIVSVDMTFTDQQAYEIKSYSTVPKIKKMVKTIPSLRNLVVYHEILGKPKAFRDIDSHDFPCSD